MAWMTANLKPNFYWIRLYDKVEHESYWTIRLYDGNDWTSLGLVGKQIESSSLVWPIQPPVQKGRVVDMWANRPYGFYWMYCPDWCQDGPHIKQWSIAEFYGFGWRVMDSDEMWTDNDMQRYPVVGPILAPCKNTGGGE